MKSAIKRTLSVFLIFAMLISVTPIMSNARGYTDWGPWSAWQDSAVTPNDLTDVQTQQVVASSTTTYNYYRYANSSGTSGSYYYSSSYPNYDPISISYRLTEKSTSGDGKGYKYWYNGTNYRTYWECDPCEVTTYTYKTQYRYRTRTYTYSISYNANGGSGAPSAQTKTHNTTLTLSSTVPSKSYTITYNANGGSVFPSNKTVSCTFKNWNTNSGGSGTSYSKGASFTSNADTTLYAQWTNPTAGTLPTPTRTGYSFAGWYTAASGGSQITSSSTISANTTIYAHWTPYAVTVNYYSNYATEAFAEAINAVSADKNVLVRENAKYNYGETSQYGLHDYSQANSSTYLGRTGYTGSGYWNSKQDGTGYRLNQLDSVTGQSLASAFGLDLTKGNVTINLYPEWVPNTYYVKYDGNGSTSGEMSNSIFTYDQSGNLKSNEYQKQAYLFNGWNTESDGSGQSYANNAQIKNLTTVNGDTITLYAQWLLNEYTVSFDKNGGQKAPSSQAKVHDIDLTLTEELPEKSYTISYDLTVSSGSTTPEFYPQIRKISAEFTRWNTKADGTGTTYIPGGVYSVNEDVILYARWNPAKLPTLSNPTRTGYSFQGWFGRYSSADTDFDKSIIQYGYTAYGISMSQGMQIYGDITIHPEWTPKTYTVNFDANGGTANTSSKQVTFDGIYGELPIPTYVGHVFDGWYTEKEAGDLISASTDYTTATNVTLYAHWSEKEIKSIGVNLDKTKTSYYVGDTFDGSQITISVKYIDGEVEEKISGFEYTEPVLNKVSQKRVTVTYKGFTTTFNISINNAPLEKIEVLHEPNKTVYHVGDKIDKAGLVVEATYSNNYSRTLEDGYDLIYNLNASGVLSVQISYTENDITKTTSFNVTVLSSPKIHSDEQVIGYCGETVSIPVYISDNTGIMGFGLELSYDSDVMTPIAVNKSQYLAGSIGDSISTSTDNTFKIFWTGSENYTGNQLIFTVDFSISNSAYGDYEIGVSYLKDDTFDESWNAVNLDCSNISLKVNDRDGSVSKLIIRNGIAKTGSYFDLPIRIENATTLKNVILEMQYDNTAFIPTEIIGSAGNLNTSNISDASGKIVASFNPASSTGFTSGVLCTIRFKVNYVSTGDYQFALSCSGVDKCESAVISVVNGPARIYADNITNDNNLISVPVKIQGNQGLMGMKLIFEYDAQVLRPISVIRGAVLSQGTMDDSISSATSNSFSVVWVGNDDVNQNGELMVINFEKIDVANNSTTLNIDYSTADTFDNKWHNVELTCDSIEISSTVVIKPEIESIQINTLPTKTIYEIGESFVSTGLSILAAYSDGSTQILTSGFDVAGFSSTSSGTKVLTVTYEGKTTTFNVTVKEKEVDPNTTQLVVGKAQGNAGDTVEVTLSLKNNSGIAGLVVSLSYDTSVLTLKQVKKGSLFSGFTSGRNLAWDESQNVDMDGLLATLVFEISEDAPADEYSIDAIIRSCVDEDTEDVAIVATQGYITVFDFVYGDANGDSVIDMKDVVLLRKYIVNYDYDTGTSSVEVGKGADANGDGKIDMKDVVLLRKYIVNYDYDTGTSTVVLGPQTQP